MLLCQRRRVNRLSVPLASEFGNSPSPRRHVSAVLAPETLPRGQCAQQRFSSTQLLQLLLDSRRRAAFSRRFIVCMAYLIQLYYDLRTY